MANINLYSDNETSATSVSNIFIDEYMSDANGEFVKVYLYLLRQLNAPEPSFSISAIADKFEHTEKDIKRALSYWERMQLLRLEYDTEENLTGIRLLDTHSKKETPLPTASAAPVPAAEIAKAEPLPVQAAEPQEKYYSADDLKKFREQETVAELLFIAERYLGRMLSQADLNAIFYWYDELKFSTDLIEYLIEYCVNNGHTSIHYIKKVALGWHDSHVTTVEQAKLATTQYSQSNTVVMKSLGITGRVLVPSEISYIEKWKNEYGFSLELISAACQRTIQTIHQPSFEYTDSILTSWKKNGVTSPEDIAKLDDAHAKRKKAVTAPPIRGVSKNKFNNFEQRSYDYDQLEKMLLTTSVQ